MTGPPGPSALPRGLADLERFAGEVAGRLRTGAWPGRAAGDSGGPVFVARAPGRLDVMGGIADYSGALVLQWPIREATRVALLPWSEQRLSITSVGDRGLERHCDVPLGLIADAGRSYDDVRAWFGRDPECHWAAYVAGVFHVLAREHGVQFGHGAAILIESDVPEGKGVSSSAAIEAATMEAVLAAWDVGLEPRMRAVRCQQVENLIVGAPCGVMDQMASICGEAGSLMSLLCQPAEFQGTCGCPTDWACGESIRASGMR